MAASRRSPRAAPRPTPLDTTVLSPPGVIDLSRVTPTQKRRHEQLAWLVILACFVTFLVVLIGGPLATRHYLNTAMASRNGDLEVIRPIVLIRTDQATQTGVTDMARVGEGQTIVTDNESRALLTLFDGSTVQIYPNSEVLVNTLREPHFAVYGLSRQPNEIALAILTGTVKVGVALPDARQAAPVFTVTSPHLRADLIEGGYFFDVGAGATDVHAYNHEAQVTSAMGGAGVAVQRGQHTQVLTGALPQTPTASEVNLVNNGDFSAPLNGGWRIVKDQGGDGPSVDPDSEIAQPGDRQALRLWRTGSEFAPGRGNHANIRAIQTLNRNLPDPYTSLKLRAEVRVNEQNLSGGGYLDTEYPLILRVVYKDAFGSEHEWWRGFYVQNDAQNPVAHGEMVRRGVWTPVEYELRQGQFPPFQIMRVEVQAAGWDFDSQVSDIRLTVR